MLYLIGLGLGDATDITVKGLQAVKSCSRVYLEAYTSILTVGKEALVSPGRKPPEPSTRNADRSFYLKTLKHIGANLFQTQRWMHFAGLSLMK